MSDLAANVALDAVGAAAGYCSAIKATALTATANSGQNQIVVANPVAAGDEVGMNLGSSPSEIRTVLSVTGSGPYTATLDANLTNTYASGIDVAHAPKESATVREPSGGSPAYARKAVTWNASASRDLDSSNTPRLDVPASTKVGAIGFHSAASAGNFYGSGLINVTNYTSQGTLDVSDADALLS
jgi:hypothetical protein